MAAIDLHLGSPWYFYSRLSVTIPIPSTGSGKPDVKHLLCCARRKHTYHSLHLLYTTAEFLRDMSKNSRTGWKPNLVLVYFYHK